MNDWRSGLMLRTFQRLALRAPFVVIIVGGMVLLNYAFTESWNELLNQLRTDTSATEGRLLTVF
jgi:hypothetical protein